MKGINSYHRSLLEAFYEEGYTRVKLTRDWYTWRIRPFLSFLEAEGIALADTGPSEIKRHFARLVDEGYSWSTRNGSYTALSVFFRWLVARGLVERSPFDVEEIKRPRKTARVQYLVEIEELQKLFDTIRAEDSVLARRDYALILLMFDTGLRRAEAASLKISDIRMKQNLIVIRVAKNNNQRIVPCQTITIDAVERWLEVHPTKDEGHLFVALRGKSYGKPLSGRRIHGILASWLEKAGIEDSCRITPHSLRRAFATYFSDAGGDMFVLRDILGHKGIETTRLYVINTQKRIQLQHTKHSPVNLLDLR
ncbi:MAG: hypothetical protein D6706_09555 [Chloroflexi bacterium]|nr:MAG: hypothetical protein D6706_09555 [Chloroflexota bacterium]